MIGSMKNTTRELARYETALELLNMMVAGASAEIAAEERNERPNDGKIAKLAQDQAEFRRASMALDPEDEDAIDSVIRIYGAHQRDRRAGVEIPPQTALAARAR